MSKCSSQDPVALLREEVRTLKTRVAELEDHNRTLQADLVGFIEESNERFARIDQLTGSESAPPSQYTLPNKG